MFFFKIFLFKDRYRLVPYPSCSLRLFSLQIDLLDNFLKKLKFTVANEQFDLDPLSKEFCSILNSIVYVADVLQQWKTRSVSLLNKKKENIDFYFSTINVYNIYSINIDRSMRIIPNSMPKKIPLQSIQC